MKNDPRKRLDEPLASPRPARPARPWVLPLAIGIAVVVIVFVLLVVVVSGQRFF